MVEFKSCPVCGALNVEVKIPTDLYEGYFFHCQNCGREYRVIGKEAFPKCWEADRIAK